jgi:hypothetical protein
MSIMLFVANFIVMILIGIGMFAALMSLRPVLSDRTIKFLAQASTALFLVYGLASTFYICYLDMGPVAFMVVPMALLSLPFGARRSLKTA